MLTLRFTGAQGAINSLSSVLRSEVKRLSDTVYSEVRSRTPVATGTAKAGWNKSTKPTEFTISNAVPYIEVLDKGRHMTNRGMRGSKQAPKGIVGPSLESIKGRN